MWRISWSGLKKKKEKKKLSECKWAPCVVVLWRREASGEARSCCTFNSSLAIWSVPLREREEEEEEEEGGGCKSCVHPLLSSPLLSSPPSFFVMAPGRTCGGGGGRGRRGAEGLICILLPLACWPGIKPCAGQETHQTYALLNRERHRDTETSGSAYHYKSSGKINKRAAPSPATTDWN